MPDSNDIFRKLNYKDKSDYDLIKEYLATTHPKGKAHLIDPRFYVERAEPKGDARYVNLSDADSLMTAANTDEKFLVIKPRAYLNKDTIELSAYASGLVASIAYPYREEQALKRFDEFVAKHYTKSFVPYTSASGYGESYVSVTLSRPARDKIPDDEFYTCNKCFSLVISKFVVDHVKYHTDTDTTLDTPPPVG